MAKEKQKKQGIASKDPLYRIIMAILAVCVPVAAYFCDYFYYVVQSDMFKFLAQLKGNTSDTGETYDTVSLNKIVQEYIPLVSEYADGASGIAETLAPLKSAAISFAVFFVLAIVLAVVVFFFSCFSKKKIVPLCLSAGGVLSMIGVYASFHYIAAPILNGTISLSDFFTNPLVSAVLPFIASISEFRLTTGYFIMLFLFIAMALWAGANKLIVLGDTPKQVKKAKK